MPQLLKASAISADRPPRDSRAAVRETRQQLWLAVHFTRPIGSDALESLASWCHDLTPVVSLVSPNALTIELQGSLKLFGGLQPIKAALVEEIERRSFGFHCCAARTGLGALWLARHAESDELRSGRLADRLAALPIRATAWPGEVIDLLAGMGIVSLGDCLRLPRDGFVRRVGRAYLDELDRALGRMPSPYTRFERTENLSWKIELPVASENTQVLAVAIDKLLVSVVSSLRERQRQVQNLKLFFHHLKCPPTVQSFSLAEPVHEKHRLLDPLLARLERVRLPMPAIALSLRIDVLQPMHIREADLFGARGGDGGPTASEAVLVERLRERLGREQVYGYALAQDHRPERAWIKLCERLLDQSFDRGPVSQALGRRPLWLLPKPLPLSACAAGFYFRPPLDIDGEPERIESGWWDGGDVERDYYTATAEGGEKLWVYRDLRTRDWYLHGIFG